MTLNHDLDRFLVGDVIDEAWKGGLLFLLRGVPTSEAV
jgi:hypothetical protein